MLVLSRKKNERIVLTVQLPGIGTLATIHVGVAEIRGDKVRLGIEAPVEVAIDREEIFLRKNPSAGETLEASPQKAVA
jgi:carbon storage regulator